VINIYLEEKLQHSLTKKNPPGSMKLNLMEKDYRAGFIFISWEQGTI